MNNRSKSYLFAFSAIILWATVATAFKLTLKILNPLVLVFYASFTSSVLFFFIILIKKEVGLLFKITFSDFLKSLFSGLLNPFLYYLVLFKAYSLLPASMAQPLNYTWPIILSILSIFFLKQKIKPILFVSLLIAFIGVFVIVTKGKFTGINSNSTFGVALAISSAFIWAVYWIINLRDKRSDIVKLFYNFIIGSLASLVFILVLRIPVNISAVALSGAVYIGLFEMGVTFILWLNALKLASNTAEVNNLFFISPFLSLIFIHVFLKEPLHYSIFIGLGMIVVGIFISGRAR